jgi:hypothetical protein
MTYNLGADPAMSPKDQMRYFPVCPSDLTVYGGFYQWGRRITDHTSRCATNSLETPPNFMNGPVTVSEIDDPRFILNNNIPYNWAIDPDHFVIDSLWGNGAPIGGTIINGEMVYGNTPHKGAYDPCLMAGACLPCMNGNC